MESSARSFGHPIGLAAASRKRARLTCYSRSASPPFHTLLDAYFLPWWRKHSPRRRTRSRNNKKRERNPTLSLLSLGEKSQAALLFLFLMGQTQSYASSSEGDGISQPAIQPSPSPSSSPPSALSLEALVAGSFTKPFEFHLPLVISSW